ncbi:MAG: hypothetical protein JWR19_3683 [Pedosphaera sp.]|nr:hypothetical protein [Pedosphaera sp.]
MRGRKNREDQGRINKFQFLQVALEIGFAFRLFSLGDLFAERAGMFAVECIFNGNVKRSGSRVVREHAGPGDGL